MKRRKFLTHMASAGGLAVATKALPTWAQKGMHGGMSDMHDMMSMMGHDDVGTSLAPRDAIPMGRPFRAPDRLKNEAAAAGKFKATLVAAPTRVALMPGKATQAWTYNGHMPGPLIDLEAGNEVEITLKKPTGTATFWNMKTWA